MKIRKKIFIGIATIAVMLAGSSFMVAAVENVPSLNILPEQISGSCLTTKNSLNQLHSSDALLRVNRGQIYESMHTKLMEKFDQRLASNNINNDQFKTISQNYSSALNSFRLNYIAYEEQFARTLNIDCNKQPKQYYNAVIKTRDLRSGVHNDVVKLNELIDQYLLILDQLADTYNLTTEVKP